MSGVGTVTRDIGVSWGSNSIDEKYGELLGCHIIGSEATELIAEAGVVRTLETTQHEILNTIHAHPTISESFMEAVADAYNEAIHI